MATGSSIVAAGVDPAAASAFAITENTYTEVDANLAGSSFRGYDAVTILTDDIAYLVIAGYLRNDSAQATAGALYVEQAVAGTVEVISREFYEAPQCGTAEVALVHDDRFDPTAIAFQCDGASGQLDVTTGTIG